MIPIDKNFRDPAPARGLSVSPWLRCALGVVVVAALAVVGWLETPPALAGSSCEQYARDAVAAQEQNQRAHCGLSGPRWSADPAGHLNWCRVKSDAEVAGEANARRSELAKCNTCIGYTRDALAAAAENVTNGCGFGGPRWGRDYGGHFPWCMMKPETESASETQARRDGLALCGVCGNYAREAVAAQAQNTSRGCNLTGPRWSADPGGHFRWCIDTAARGISWEASERRNLLARCAAAPGNAARCDAYAKRAIAQYGQSRRQNCSVSSNRWHDSYPNHYNWCMAVPESEANRHLAERDQELGRCGGGPAPWQPETVERCCSSPSASGFVLVEDSWNPTRCGGSGPAGRHANVCFDQRFDNAPVGTTMRVCERAPTPPGWVVTDHKWIPGVCDEGTTGSSQSTVKFIRRVQVQVSPHGLQRGGKLQRELERESERGKVQPARVPAVRAGQP